MLSSTFKVVVKNHSRLSEPVFERMHVAAQEVFHGLIEEEFQIQSPGIRQRHHEAGQGSLGPPHHHVSKVSQSTCACSPENNWSCRNGSWNCGRKRATVRRNCTTLPL